MNMNIDNGISRSEAASLTGISRSMIYYRKRKRSERYDANLEDLISNIVNKR